MKCRNCGADLEEGTLFCPVCGKEVQWVPEYNTLETLIKQREIEEQEKKRREMEARKERRCVVGVFFEAVLMGTWEMKTCKRDF